MIHFKEHIPSYCDYGEPIELDFETLEDLLKYLESHFDFCPPRYNLVWSCNGEYDSLGRQNLMMSSTVKKGSWYVMGFITGVDLAKHFPQFDKVYKKQQISDISQPNNIRLTRKTLFEEMNKIGMFEENEYTIEDFKSICEDLAELIWFVDTLFSGNDFETIKKLLLVIFHKYVKNIDLLNLLVTLGIVDEIDFKEDELLKVCDNLPECIDFIDGISTNNDENTFKKLLLCILYKEDKN